MTRLLLVSLLLSIWSSRPMVNVTAQDSQPAGPVYIVQEGDSLWDIAARFRVSVDELVQVNSISDPNQLKAGMQLIIPGLEGMQGVLETRTVDLGEDLTSLSRRDQVPVADLARLNHLTSPGELYAGSSLVLPVRESSSGLGQRATLSPGQSLLELAILQGTNPWSIVQANDLAGTAGAIPGDTFFVHGTDDSGPGALPGGVHKDSARSTRA